ncbi:hemerythrin HHE cation binding domain-containing protein [Sarocladium implicatum]|nr:hemerythrin HHE cation binding domain-containing protein [Sarocladium implicatum]
MTERTQHWCDGPYKLISGERTGCTVGVKKQTGAEAVSTEMVIMHNTLIRTINAIYIQAVNVSTKGSAQDKSDFANYAYQWSVSVASHHKLEEEAIFPRIAKETGVGNIMETCMEEHHAFEAGLDAYEKYLADVKAGKAELDGQKLTNLIDELMPTLYSHLDNEIETLMSLKQYDDKCDLEKIFREEVEKALNMAMKDSYYRNDLLPCPFIGHDKKFEDGVWMDFPPVPWLAMMVIRWVFYRTHLNWWRFAPCDIYSMPQELPFA